MRAEFISPNERHPGVHQDVELQRQAGLVPLAARVLLIGYRDESATDELDGVLHEVEDRNQVQRDHGPGSMLDLMVAEALESGRLALQDAVRGSTPSLYTLAVREPSGVGAEKATYPLTIGGTATAAGSLRIIAGPDDITVPTLAGESAETIAARCKELFDARAPEMIFTATTSGATLTLTARHAGTWANGMSVFAETRNAPGVNITVDAGTPGAGNTDLQLALDAAFGVDFDAVVVPQDDAATRALLKPHVQDGWDYTRKRYHVIVAAQGGDVADAQTAAAEIDDFRVILAHAEQTISPRESARSLPFQVAAGVAGRLWSQNRPNWNFNRATLPSYGRPRSIDRDVVNDAINAGVCVVLEPERGNAPAAFVDPVSTAITDQTGVTDASDTTYQPVEYAKTVAFLLRQMQIALDRFSQEDADDETRISAIAAAQVVLEQAAEDRIIRPPDDESVTAAFDFVGARTDLVIALQYRVITGLDVIAVKHNIRRPVGA